MVGADTGWLWLQTRLRVAGNARWSAQSLEDADRWPERSVHPPIPSPAPGVHPPRAHPCTTGGRREEPVSAALIILFENIFGERKEAPVL